MPKNLLTHEPPLESGSNKQKRVQDLGLSGSFAIVGDIHAPLENKRSLDVILNVCSDLKPSGLIQMGDFGDVGLLSSHTKAKPSEKSLRQEQQGVVRVRKAFDDVGFSWKKITLGNHEDRIPRYLMSKAPELFEFLDPDKLFGFSENGWEVTPFKAHTTIGKMTFTHCIDPSMTGINAVRQSGFLAGKSIVIGHVHRMQLEYFGKITGKHFVAHCPGWVGSDKAAEYLSKAKIWSQWQQGFTLGYVEGDGVVHLHPVPIVNGRAVVNGKAYRG